VAYAGQYNGAAKPRKPIACHMSKKISTTGKGKQNQGLARCCIAA
jgi:hypothetical protein